MKILIDMQGCQSASRFRGIGRYSLALTKAIIRNRGEHQVMLLLNGLYTEGLEELKAQFREDIPAEHILVFDADGPVAEFEASNSRRTRIAELVRERTITSINPDVVLLTSLFEGFVDDAITSVGLIEGGPFTAVTLYDLIPYLNPDPNWPTHYKDYYNRKIESLKRVDLLLSISKYSQTECSQAIPELANRIVNMSSAANLNAQPNQLNDERSSVVRQKYAITRPFIMSVGNLEVRKNYEGLVRSFGLLPTSLKSELDLLLIGGGDDPRVEQLFKTASETGLKANQLRVLSHISDDDLVVLYSMCELFVFPSLHEGFGLPPLEAMACGAAVIGSNTTSVPEVIGRPDAMFDPASPQEISVLMAKVLTEPAFKKSLQEHALLQAGSFSWDRTAKTALQAFERKAGERRLLATASRKDATQSGKPRLAIIVPLPPEQTGIAVYAAELMPALSKFYEITVITDQPIVAPGAYTACITVHPVPWFEEHAREFERIVYHIGNSPFHAHMFDLLKRHPGVIVLHDFYLGNVFKWLELEGNLPNAFKNALLRSDGYRALEVLEKDGAAEAIVRFPCNFDVVSNALGIIVHSQFSRNLIASNYGNEFSQKVRVTKLQRAVAQNVDRATARRLLGLSEGEFVVCAFGFMDYTKLNHQLLDAWTLSSLGLDKRCKLVFVGGKTGGEYGCKIDTQIAAINNGARISITDFINAEIFSNYLAAADIAVQLRTNSRGETSGTILDCLAHGIPLIVNSHGPVNEYPDDLFLRLKDDFSITELVKALDCLKNDASLRKHLSTAGLAYLRSHHSHEQTAAAYQEVIESVIGDTELQRQKRTIENFWNNFPETSLEARDAVANNIGNGMCLPRKSKLYLDISATAQSDLKTGIERVARAYLQELLQSPPIGYDVEPVYLSNERGRWRVRKALQYLSKQPGFQLVRPVDELVLPEVGDILFGLDLFTEGVVSAATQGLYTYWQARDAQTGFFVHDLLPISHPQFFPAWAEASHTQWIETVCDNADILICNSSTVKDALAHWINVHRKNSFKLPKLEFCHLGADLNATIPSTGLSDDAETTLSIFNTSPTFLMVGTIEPRKGYLQTLAAFEKLWQHGVNVNLVIVGSEGWKPVEPSQRRTIPEIVDKLQSSPHLNSRLFWLEGISDEYLEQIYSSSTCLIAASEGEGYGLPLIEAAQHSLPIIARDIPVFREVADNGAYYFRGQAAEDIERAVVAWLELEREGKTPDPACVKWSTWRESAQRLKRLVVNKRQFSKESCRTCQLV